MTPIRRTLWQVFTVLAAAPVLLWGIASLVHDRRHEFPPPQIFASRDARIVERGRYLVYGPAGCARCHTRREDQSRLQRGEELPLVGGRRWSLAVGDVYAANITPDMETGIGGASDGEIARAIRNGVRTDGRIMVPVMEYPGIADEDLVAIISYLRSLKPVRNDIPGHRWNTYGRIARAFLLQPVVAAPPPPQKVVRGVTVEYGAYLANEISQCGPCHTERNLVTSRDVGPWLAGGTRFPHETDPTKVVIPPNLTPDPKTGRISGWTEQSFLARMRAGPTVPTTHMPWGAFRRTEDDDLRAIYLYLRSVEPVERDTGPNLQDAP